MTESHLPSLGVNTVYQGGAAGAFANGGIVKDAAVTILPGFNMLSEKTAETASMLTAIPPPFGLWLANPTILFVADEGDASLEGASGKVTTFAGLQEWTYSTTKQTWALIATYLGRLNL